MSDMIVARIKEIESVENLNIIHLEINDIELKMLSLDLAANMSEGRQVSLNIKPLSIALGKEVSGDLSFSNQLPSVITAIYKGELLSSVELRCGSVNFESVISTQSLNTMQLNDGDHVMAYIRASEISIEEVLS
jgi:molybdopterin-binding protein